MKMEFVGVTTGASSINRLFPLWARELGLDGAGSSAATCRCGAPPEAYRAAVEEIRDDPETLGALVTTHKLAVLDSARDLFDELNGSRRAAGRGVEHLQARRAPARPRAGPDHRRLRAPRRSGRSTATCCAWGPAAPAPRSCCTCSRSGKRIAVTDTHPERLEEVAAPRRRRDPPGGGRPRAAGGAPAGSLVINATGLGKDRPGSPLPDGARFPDERRRVGAQLPRRAGLPAPGASPAGAARARRLAVLPLRLGDGDRRGVRPRDHSGALRAPAGDCRSIR